MIFVVLGTQKFQCNRLLEQVDQLVSEGTIKDKVFAQKGNSDYIPKNYEYIDFVEKAQFEELMEQCDVLVTHSGVGTILSGKNHGKPVIVFPRLKKYGEHVDDHQLDIARAFGKKNLVLMCGENDDLGELIEKARKHSFDKYVSQRTRMIQLIEDYIKEEENV